MSEDVTVTSASQELQQAAATVAELAANPEVVAALAAQGFEINQAAVQNGNTVPDPSTGFFGVYVEPAVEKVEQTVEAAVQAVETEAVQVEQAVVAEVEKVVEAAKEGFVAGEHLVREKIDIVLHGSHIKNPA